MLRLWSVVSRLLGAGAILFGIFGMSHAPTDIQLGIVTTSLLGGAVLCFIGVGLIEVNKLRAEQTRLAEMLAGALSPPAPTPPLAMTASERDAYDRKLTGMVPSRFAD